MSRGYIAGFVGVEGCGKTLTMSAYALRHRAQGNPVLGYPGWYLKDGRKGSPTFGQPWSEPIDPAQSLLIQNLPRKAGMFIDELPQFYDSMLSATTTSRLFGQVGTQRRKIDLTIGYTAQNWLHVHPRIRYATHFLIVCRDQYFDPWQRADGRERGQFINLTCWDLKGFVTGREWTCMGMSTLFAHHYWDYYDTESIVDAADGMIQVTTKKRQITYDARLDAQHRIYQPGEKVEDELGTFDRDAPPPPVDLTGDSQADIEILTKLAEQGITPAKLAAVSRGLARGRR